MRARTLIIALSAAMLAAGIAGWIIGRPAGSASEEREPRTGIVLTRLRHLDPAYVGFGESVRVRETSAAALKGCQDIADHPVVVYNATTGEEIARGITSAEASTWRDAWYWDTGSITIKDTCTVQVAFEVPRAPLYSFLFADGVSFGPYTFAELQANNFRVEIEEIPVRA